MRRRFFAALTLGAATALFAVAPAGAANDAGVATASGGDVVAGTSGQGAPLAGDIRVDFRTNRFVARNGRLVARGQVIATYTSPTGEVTRVTKPTIARVLVSKRTLQGRARTCTVLRLVLGPVNLNLLGLEVDLRGANGGPVVLTITANPRGGILGRLFCSLTRGNILGQRAVATARRLNREIVGSEAMSAAGLGAPLVAGTAQAQQQTCEILNLVLGPLDLRLLGLRVHLNRIRLRITAHQGGGLLGDLLCGLAAPTLPTTP